MLGTNRPKNNNREMKRAASLLEKHFKVMNMFIEEGMPKEEASKKAYDIVTKNKGRTNV